MSNSIFRYPGGKSKSAKLIIKHFPSFKEYREPFVGGGSVFFKVSMECIRWINDIHPGLIAVYLAVRNNCESFIDDCLSIKDIKEEFEKIKMNTTANQAVRYFLINRTCWIGRVNYNIPSRINLSQMTNPEGWNIIHTNKIKKASDILQKCIITCSPYDALIYNTGEDVFLYVDPPYVRNTFLGKTSQLYQYNFEIKDHEKLCDDLTQCKHKFCLSYDNHPLILKLYKDFNIVNLSWQYVGTSNKVKKDGQEILVKNY